MRAALIDRFGGSAAMAARPPGRCTASRSDVWSALAIAVAYADRREAEVNGDNIVPWNQYAREEWERMGISWTAADPLSVDEEPWQTDLDPLVPARGSVVGLVLLVLAFAAGVVVGVVVWHD